MLLPGMAQTVTDGAPVAAAEALVSTAMRQVAAETAARRLSASLRTSMKRIFAIFLFSLSAIGADTPVAIVKWTNVLGVAVVDLGRFDPTKITAGASNVVITPEALSIIKPGFRCVGGVFYKENGKPIDNGQKAVIDRAQLLSDTINDLDLALANWDALAAAQQKAVLKRLTQVIRILLVERRNEFTVQEAQ